MRFYFAVISSALVLAAVSGGALLWDGSYYLYRILDTHIPVERFPGSLDTLLALPVLLAAGLTNQVAVLQAIFGLTYALVPILSLALSWWIVRRQAPSLFIWPALGIGVGTLMLQLHLVAEPIISIQLFWPVLMAILTRPRRQVYPVALLLCLALLFVHPLSIILFAIAGITTLVLAWRDPSDRLDRVLLAIGFGVLAAIAAIKYSPIQSSLASEGITPAGLQSSFDSSMMGIPTFGFLGIYAVTAILFIVPLLNSKLPSWWKLLFYAIEFVGLVVIGGLFLMWAGDVRWWSSALSFKAAAFAVSLPFFSIAILETLVHGSAWFSSPESDWGHRNKATLLIGIIFAVVLCAQSLSWLSLSNQVRATMAEASATCISASTIPKSARTPLGHWSATAYSLLLQGMTPAKVILTDDRCSQTDFSKGLPIAAWEVRDWQSGGFNMHLLSTQLAGSSHAPQ